MAIGVDDTAYAKALAEMGTQTFAPSATAVAPAATSSLANLIPIIGPLIAIASGFSKVIKGHADTSEQRQQNALNQAAAFRAQDNQVRNGWQQQAEVDFQNLIKNTPHLASSMNQILSSDQGKQGLQNLYAAVEQRTKKQWEWDHAGKYGYRPEWETAPGSRGYIDSPYYAESTQLINDSINNLIQSNGISSQPASSALTSTAGQSVSLDPNSPTLGATSSQATNQPAAQAPQQNFMQQLMSLFGGGAATQGASQPSTQTGIAGGQSAPQQQNFLQQLMSAFNGPGNNNVLAQAGQGAGIGAGNSMGLNPLLGGVVGAGLGQIGSAAGNLLPGLFQGGNQSGQQQSGYSGVNTGDSYQQSNSLNDLFQMFGIQNPAQAGLGAGILGLGQLLDKDVKLPDFWEDRGVKDLAAWGQTNTHPMDANVEAAIQRSMDIQNEQQLRNLRDVYKNARPGGDYLNDSAYQRDLDNLNRKMALNTADAKAGSQLQSNAQQIGIKTNLASGSVGQGLMQGLIDTQKQTNQNKLFGDLGSAFLTGSMKR